MSSGVRGYKFRGTRVLVPGYEGISSGVRGYDFWGTRVLVQGCEGMSSGVRVSGYEGMGSRKYTCMPPKRNFLN